jgi:hypothetical protein
MTKKNSSSNEPEGFRLARKINIFFIILFTFPIVPITVGFMGVFDQITQPAIVHTTLSENSGALYTINLEESTIYYIEMSLNDIDTSGDFTADLSFFKGSEEVYHQNIQQTIRTRQRGLIRRFIPFISELGGSYIINCTINYPDITYPFYIKMQRAAEISQITGFSGEDILGVGMIMFIAVIVLLIIVSLIARIRNAVNLRKLASKPEDTPSKFEWKSKNGNEDS